MVTIINYKVEYGLKCCQEGLYLVMLRIIRAGSWCIGRVLEHFGPSKGSFHGCLFRERVVTESCHY